MKALQKIKRGPGEILIPNIDEIDVLGQLKATDLCRSDVDVYEWTPLVASANPPLLLIMGHEFLGEAVEMGSAVQNL